MGEPYPAAPVGPPLYVDVGGTGPDLVLLHGWGFDSNAWGDFSRRLEPHFRVRRIDLPGHGRSHGVCFEGLQVVTEQVARVIPPGSTVCGWSLGGLVALQLALSNPARVARLVLIAATPCFVARDDWNSGMPVPTFDGFRESLAVDRERALRRFAGLVASGSADPRERTRQLTSMTASASPDAASLDAALVALRTADLRMAVTEVTAPALVIHGLVPVDAGQWLALQLATRGAAIGGARLEVLAGAGHAPFLDAPGQVAGLILNWHD